MAKKKWFSEEELCNLIEKEMKEYGAIGDILNGGYFFREFIIAHGLRLDFLNNHLDGTNKYYDIIEVKVHADVDSLAQLANYLWIFNSHIRKSNQIINPDKLIFRGHLMARTFDRGVYSLASELNYRLWRLKPEEESLKIQEELHPFEDCPLDSKMICLLNSADIIDSLFEEK